MPTVLRKKDFSRDRIVEFNNKVAADCEKCKKLAVELLLAWRYSIIILIEIPEEIKDELSDFLYHAMVLMVERGVTWDDIVKELADR